MDSLNENSYPNLINDNTITKIKSDILLNTQNNTSGLYIFFLNYIIPNIFIITIFIIIILYFISNYFVNKDRKYIIKISKNNKEKILNFKNKIKKNKSIDSEKDKKDKKNKKDKKDKKDEISDDYLISEESSIKNKNPNLYNNYINNNIEFDNFLRR